VPTQSIQVRLLGPVDVIVDDVVVQVPGLRRKAVLAALALQSGELVSTGRLVDMVWGEQAPATVSNTLQVHVSQLRVLLGDRATILGRRPGYMLDLGGEATDVRAAERLLHQGTASADPRRGAEWLQAAVDLWRGAPLADVAGIGWFDEQAQRLSQLGLRARRTLVEARLALGQHLLVLSDLASLRREHPTDEQIHELLMLALYRSGRQADALAAYQDMRRTLDDELGIGPSRSARDLEAAILRQDPALDIHQPAVAVSAPPAQLPAAVTAFVGRERELARLDQIVCTGGDPATGVVAVSGTAGVGKTTLAVHWAHRVAPRFPDGQLYVNLRGFDPGGSMLTPSDAVRGFLHAFAVPTDRIPADLDAQVGLYRSLLAGKRMLVVLDNARDAEHVRPLLPGAPGCMALVTSRTELTPLVAAAGAYPVALDLLSTAEAHDLLARRIGVDRMSAEPSVAHDIIARCARLPLALALFAARAVHRPDVRLAVLALRLRTVADTLDALDGGDLSTDLRAVFSWSYQTLGAPAQSMFRLLGLHPGQDITVTAAASLAAVPRREAGRLLAQLAGAHLLTEQAAGRYTCHDLLRAYANELAQADDRQAVQRIVDHYLHTAYAGTRLLDANQPPTAPPEPLSGVTTEELSDGDSAAEWFAAERPALLAAVSKAAGAELHAQAWQLAAALAVFLDRQGHWRDLSDASRTALDSARSLGDLIGQSHSLRGLGLASARLGLLDDTHAHTQEALDISRRTGDRNGQARAHLTLSWVLERRHRHHDALGHGREALELYLATGNRAGLARAHSSLGWNHARLGDHEQAVACCRRALPLHRETDDVTGEANTWDSLGDIHRSEGDHRQAAVCYRRAADLHRRLTDRHHEAASLTALGDSHRSVGEPDAARDAWQQAQQILRLLAAAAAEPILAKGAADR
jgi:DNA-binding SARP family transcriptional activator/tetratricopeptide (TPR) repeat protein